MEVTRTACHGELCVIVDKKILKMRDLTDKVQILVYDPDLKEIAIINNNNYTKPFIHSSGMIIMESITENKTLILYFRNGFVDYLEIPTKIEDKKILFYKHQNVIHQIVANPEGVFSIVSDKETYYYINEEINNNCKRYQLISLRYSNGIAEKTVIPFLSCGNNDEYYETKSGKSILVVSNIIKIYDYILHPLDKIVTQTTPEDDPIYTEELDNNFDKHVLKDGYLISFNNLGSFHLLDIDTFKIFSFSLQS